jgi:HK97 family phage prohead protease
MTKKLKKQSKAEFQKLFTKAQIVDKDVAAGTFTAVASTARVDRHGEIVSPEGWDLESFKKNPVLLWSHDHTIPAIGKATKIWVEGIGAQAKLMFSGVWQTVTDEGKAAAQLVADGILNSFSVGFLPTDMVGNKYTEQELLEISLVNVPANPDAMMLAYKSLKDNGFNEDIAKNITRQFAGLGQIRKDLFSTDRGAIQDELDAEAAWEMKRENMEDIYDIFWAFCDIYYSQETPPDDFNKLLAELITLLQSVADGSFEGGEPDEGDTAPISDPNSPDVIEDATDGSKVIDKHKENNKTVDNKAKEPATSAPLVPSQQTLRAKQSVTKAVAKAADQLLAGEKRGNTKEERVDLLKVIKRGAEILSKSNKGDLNNG